MEPKYDHIIELVTKKSVDTLFFTSKEDAEVALLTASTAIVDALRNNRNLPFRIDSAEGTSVLVPSAIISIRSVDLNVRKVAVEQHREPQRSPFMFIGSPDDEPEAEGALN